MPPSKDLTIRGDVVQKLVVGAMGALITLVVTVVGWIGLKGLDKLDTIGAQVANVDSRLTVIESNMAGIRSLDERVNELEVFTAEIRSDRYTTSDALRDLQRFTTMEDFMDLRLRVRELENVVGRDGGESREGS